MADSSWKDYLKGIRKARRQAEIDAGMVGRWKNKTIPDKKKEESKTKCRQPKSLKDREL